MDPAETRPLTPDELTRRQVVVEMLIAMPALTMAAVYDEKADPVPVAIAIRDRGFCEVLIPREQFSPFQSIELVRRNAENMN